MTKPKNPHAVALGTLGGSAGKGASKARTPEQARKAAEARWGKTKPPLKKTKVGPGAYELTDHTGQVLGRYGGRAGDKWAVDAQGSTITEGTSVSVGVLVDLIRNTSTKANPEPARKTQGNATSGQV